VRVNDIAVKRKEYGLPDTPEGRRRAAEEVLASMAEATPDMGWVKRAIAAIRTWLRKAGLNLTLSDNDLIAQFILPAREFVTRGEQAQSRFAEPVFQRAWHGSPYRGIEKDGFKLNKIGSGAGERAYGYGIYFAGDKQVAEHYRDAQNGGQLYNANIPEDHELIHHDKPFSQQPPKVQKALKAIWNSIPDEETRQLFGSIKPDTSGKDLYGAVVDMAVEIVSYEDPDGDFGDKYQEAAALLAKHGIPGLRYLDGNSRNYVCKARRSRC